MLTDNLGTENRIDLSLNKVDKLLSPLISPILECFYSIILILLFRCVTVKRAIKINKMPVD